MESEIAITGQMPARFKESQQLTMFYLEGYRDGQLSQAVAPENGPERRKANETSVFSAYMAGYEAALDITR